MCRKTTKIVATRGQILRLKCIKYDFGWGCTPDAAALPRPPSWIYGVLPLRGGMEIGREGREMKGREGRGERGRKEERGRRR